MIYISQCLTETISTAITTVIISQLLSSSDKITYF